MVDDRYMRRCFELARQAAGQVSPNPMVGAVLVYQDRIIGEGLHQKYGTAHAEVNAINSVLPEDRHLIKAATLYVSLEPCCIYGNTPPCTQLIIQQQIPRVVIATIDQTASVRGKGVEQLREAGIEVVSGILEAEGRQLAALRNTYVSQQRPYLILKYAISQNQLFAPLPSRQQWLSNAYSKRLVHRWRMEADAILVGTHTALIDDPALNNRFYYGGSPLRVVIDRQLRLPPTAQLFNQETPTLVFTQAPPANTPKPGVDYVSIDFQSRVPEQIVQKLGERGITSLLIEGGAQTLNSFIEAKLWDEARVLQTPRWLPRGIPAPVLPAPPRARYPIADDLFLHYLKE